MKCDQCEKLIEIDQLAPEEAAEELEVTEYHCPQCGAALYSLDTEITSFCSFCGSNVVLTGKIGQTRRPAKIVPFHITREECEKLFREHLKSYPMVPKALKLDQNIAHFRPIYVPFWSYTIDAHGPVKILGTKTYTQKSGRYDYLYEEKYDLSRTVKLHKEGILYDASTVFEDETAARLKHTTRGEVPFHPAYLSGFYAHGADVDPKTYEAEAAAAAVRVFVENTLNNERMSSVELKDFNGRDFGLPDAHYQEELLLLPVWLLVYRSGQRVLTATINGLNGQMVCDLPVSMPAFAGTALALGGSFAAALLFGGLTLTPRWLLLLCALLMMLIHLSFSKSIRQLSARDSRSAEPAFNEKGKLFNGPAQSRLRQSGFSIIAGKGITTANQYEWARFLFMLCLVGGIYGIVHGVIWLSEGGPAAAAVASDAVSKFGPLLPLAVIMIFTFRLSGSAIKAAPWPGALACLAIIVGFFNQLVSPGEAVLFYACPLLLLLAAAAELILLLRAYNQYASRPVPFYAQS